MQRLTRRLLASSSSIPSSGASAGNSAAAKDTLNLQNATTGFFGAALGLPTADDPAPADLRHSSGLDSLFNSAASKSSQSSASALPPVEPVNVSKRSEAKTENELRASPSDQRRRESFVVERALYVNPPPTAKYTADGRLNSTALLASSGGGDVGAGGGGGAAVGLGGEADSSSASSSKALLPRRWSREAGELCVEHTIRTRRNLTDYVVTYKWDDPHWRPLLLLPAGNPIALEMRARHCNYALKHIAQKGHAVYKIQHVQHSVLHPRGIAERSYVETSTPRGERLLTNIIHEGVLDARDVGNINAPRGVIGVSQVQGYAHAFQRRPNLWQRSRRVGALQAEMGAIEWELHGPAEVGRSESGHVMLLSPHTKFVGGGLSTIGIVSSIHMAQHPFHYVSEFEAPATTIMDAIHQAAHLLARKNKLIKPDGSEQLHMLGSLCRTDYPFSPVELDLHFRIQLSAPSVMRHKEEYPSSLIGAPLADGAPVFMCQFQITQGVANYIYDDDPVNMPAKWWQQKNSLPYMGNFYFCRTGQLHNLEIFEEIANPFDKINAAGGLKGRAPRKSTVGAVTAPLANTHAATTAAAAADANANASGGGVSGSTSSADTHTNSAAEEAFYRTTSQHLGDEELLSTSGAVSAAVRQHYASIVASDVSNSVPPNERARGRMRRMAKTLERHRSVVKGAASGTDGPTSGASGPSGAASETPR